MTDGMACVVCGLDVSQHVMFFGEPPRDHGLQWAEFPVLVTGLFCPPMKVIKETRMENQ